MTNQIETYQVAAIQFEPELGKLAENRAKIQSFAKEAAQKGAKLIVFPEMATSGYMWESRDEIAPFVEPIPSETTALLSNITAEFNCYIVIGLPEVCTLTNIYYNTAVLIGPEGLFGKYRKTHLFAADPKWAREGTEEIPVFDTAIGKIALLICMDAMYFESTRIAALKGAEIIAFPTNWVGNSGNKPPSNTWRLRAKENNLYWIAANRFGVERDAHFTGGSAIIGPNGQVVQQLITGEGIVFGEVDRRILQTTKYLAARKPTTYQELLLHSYLWKPGETRSLLNSASFDVHTIALHPFYSLQDVRDFVKQRLDHTVFTFENRLIILSEIQITGDSSPTLEECQNLLTELAQQYNTYFVSSFIESNNTVPCSFLTSPKGVLGSYGEVHAENELASEFCVIDLPFLRVGLLTWHDAQFPESFRVLAKRGIDFVAISSGGVNEEEQFWGLKVRAYENDVALVISAPSTSLSLIFLHSQFTLVSSIDKQQLTQAFTPTMFTKTNERPFLRRLQHHLYERLIIKQPQYSENTHITNLSVNTSRN